MWLPTAQWATHGKKCFDDRLNCRWNVGTPRCARASATRGLGVPWAEVIRPNDEMLGRTLHAPPRPCHLVTSGRLPVIEGWVYLASAELFNSPADCAALLVSAQGRVKEGRPVRHPEPPPPRPPDSPKFSNPSFSNLTFRGKVLVVKAPKFFSPPEGEFFFSFLLHVSILKILRNLSRIQKWMKNKIKLTPDSRSDLG